jgi:hypothetical protein
VAGALMALQRRPTLPLVGVGPAWGPGRTSKVDGAVPGPSGDTEILCLASMGDPHVAALFYQLAPRVVGLRCKVRGAIGRRNPKARWGGDFMNQAPRWEATCLECGW